MAKSINMVVILGNLTRDPELRYTPAGHAVCSFGVATNRSWTTSEGEAQDRTEFHNVVAWNKLAEICSQYLVKGQKVYIQGRLQTRSWDGQDGVKRSRTEIVADQMVMLQRPQGAPAPVGAGQSSPSVGARPAPAPRVSETEVDGSEEVKKEMKEEIKKEALREDDFENKEQGNAKAPNEKKDAKGKEDVDPKKMPF